MRIADDDKTMLKLNNEHVLVRIVDDHGDRIDRDVASNDGAIQGVDDQI